MVILGGQVETLSCMVLNCNWLESLKQGHHQSEETLGTEEIVDVLVETQTSRQGSLDQSYTCLGSITLSTTAHALLSGLEVQRPIICFGTLSADSMKHATVSAMAKGPVSSFEASFRATAWTRFRDLETLQSLLPKIDVPRQFFAFNRETFA